MATPPVEADEWARRRRALTADRRVVSGIGRGGHVSALGSRPWRRIWRSPLQLLSTLLLLCLGPLPRARVQLRRLGEPGLPGSAALRRPGHVPAGQRVLRPARWPGRRNGLPVRTISAGHALRTPRPGRL